MAAWEHFVVGVGLLAGIAVLDVTRPFDRSWSILYLLPVLYTCLTLRGRAELFLHGAAILAALLVPMTFQSEPQWPGSVIFKRGMGVAGGLVIIALMWERRRYIV